MSAWSPSPDGPAGAVVVGFHRNFDFDELDPGCRVRCRPPVRRFVATRSRCHVPDARGAMAARFGRHHPRRSPASGADRGGGQAPSGDGGAGAGAVRVDRCGGGRPAVVGRCARRCAGLAVRVGVVGGDGRGGATRRRGHPVTTAGVRGRRPRRGRRPSSSQRSADASVPSAPPPPSPPSAHGQRLAGVRCNLRR